MLGQYENDHNTGMCLEEVSNEIYMYTSGYPFLVSRICQCLDEELGKKWTSKGVQEAVKSLIREKNTLFDDLFKNLENSKDLSDYVYELLILGEPKPFMAYDPIVQTGMRYGFFTIINGQDRTAVSNKIFELLMTDYYLANSLRKKSKQAGPNG